MTQSFNFKDHLFEIKQAIETRQFPLCKIHKFTHLKYFCATRNCPDYLNVFCEDCAPDHAGHLVLDIKDFYNELVADIQKKPKENIFKKCCTASL